MAVNCTPMYTMSIYKEHFEFLDNIMYDLLDTFLPFKGSKVNSSDNQCITDKFRPLIKKQTRSYSQSRTFHLQTIPETN